MPKQSCAVALLFFLLFARAVAFSAQSPAPLANVTIAYTSISPHYAPAWIAKETGIFRKYGINAQLVYMRGGILATQALVSKEVRSEE